VKPTGLQSMIKSFRKRPVLSIAQVLAFLIVLPAFYSTVNFESAINREQAIAENTPLPSGWTAGVMDHGSYYRWWTIQQRPILFGVSLFILVAGLLFIWVSIFWIWRQDRINQHQDRL
jgi:hypothetical protein